MIWDGSEELPCRRVHTAVASFTLLPMPRPFPHRVRNLPLPSEIKFNTVDCAKPTVCVSCARLVYNFFASILPDLPCTSDRQQSSQHRTAWRYSGTHPRPAQLHSQTQSESLGVGACKSDQYRRHCQPSRYCSTARNQKRSALIRLPAELHNRIYALVWANTEVEISRRLPCQVKYGLRCTANIPLALLATCRQIKHEVTPIAYATCVFCTAEALAVMRPTAEKRAFVRVITLQQRWLWEDVEFLDKIRSLGGFFPVLQLVNVQCDRPDHIMMTYYSTLAQLSRAYRRSDLTVRLFDGGSGESLTSVSGKLCVKGGIRTDYGGRSMTMRMWIGSWAVLRQGDQVSQQSRWWICKARAHGSLGTTWS